MTDMRSMRPIQIINLVTIVSVLIMAFAFAGSAEAKGDKVPPVCNFTKYIDQDYNLAYFDARGSYDPDGGTLREYKWDFGNGHTDIGVQPHQSYSSGNYYVTLMVVDDEHQYSTCSEWIFIEWSTSPTYTPTPTPISTPGGNSGTGTSVSDDRILELFLWVVLAGILLVALAIVGAIRIAIAILNFIIDVINAVAEVLGELIDALGDILVQVIKVVAIALAVLFGVGLFLLGVATFIALAFASASFIALFIISMGPTIVALTKIIVIGGIVLLALVGAFIVALLIISYMMTH